MIASTLMKVSGGSCSPIIVIVFLQMLAIMLFPQGLSWLMLRTDDLFRKAASAHHGRVDKNNERNYRSVD